MSPVKSSYIKLGTDKFGVHRGPNNFLKRSDAVLPPISEIPGQPGAENLQRHLRPWILTDFSGGEGRLVFDQQDPFGPPAYRESNAIDIRTRGQFSMQPIPELKANSSSATATRTEGNALTDATGSEVDSGSNLRLDAVNEGGYVTEAPGAVARTVTARFLSGGNWSFGDTITARLRIRNQTDGTDTTSTTATFTNTFQDYTLSVNFTGVAGKTYRYYAEISAYNGTEVSGQRPYLEVDYVEYTTAGALTDPRAIWHGRADNIVMVNWDGTNSDWHVWDFPNSEWDSLHSNARNSLIRAFCSSDVYDYAAYDDQTVYASDGSTHTAYLAAAPANTDAWGLAIANNRLYYLTLGSVRYLHECTLDATSGLPFTENTADYKRVMSASDFPNESALDNTYRQRITSIGNGVRFFINMRGGPTTIFEFSEGAGRPLPLTLPQGFKATAIHHYGGVTFVGGVWQNQAASPAVTRAGAFYIGADLTPRPLGIFRFHDPDDEPIRYITAWENDIYFLQGTNIWRYSGGDAGIVLERTTSASDETAARGMAVMDRKIWAAYASQGVFVTQNNYPSSNTQYLQSPVWDWDIPDINKVLTQIDVVTQPLPANTSITMDYQDNEDGAWTEITAPASASTTGSTTHTFAVWGTAAAPTTVTFRNLKWRVGLRSSDGTSTPTVRSVTARATVIDYQESFEFLVDITDDTSTHHLAGQQLSGHQKADLLTTYKSNKSLVAFEDHYTSKIPGRQGHLRRHHHRLGSRPRRGRTGDSACQARHHLGPRSPSRF